MKILNQLRTLIIVGVSVSAFSNIYAEAGGTSILHLQIRETLTAVDTNSSAGGQVIAMEHKQGRANVQTLNVLPKNLAANATYQLLAAVGDDTNSTHVADFTTDSSGAAKLLYRRVDTANSNGHLGRGKKQLPPELNPVSNIRELAIQDSSNQVVLVASFATPDKFQYLIKRALTNDGFDADAAGTLRVKGNINHSTVRVKASNLETNATYVLLLNGSISQTNTATAEGNLRIDTEVVNPVDILGVRTLSISDTSSNSVLSTILP
jgi:hypothetical protein